MPAPEQIEKTSSTNQINELRLLMYVIGATKDWFTAEEIFSDIKQYTVATIEEFLIRASGEGFFQHYCVNGKYGFKKNIDTTSQ